MTPRSGAGKARSRGGGPRALAGSLAAVTRGVFGRRGLADGAILNDWPLIAGEHLARHSLPEKVMFPRKTRAGGTLYLRIDNGSMATELLHLEPLLIERINGYFGFKAVAGLRITQGSLPKSEHRPRRGGRPLGPAEERSLAECLQDVADPDLRRSLEALGRAVIGRKPA